MTKVAIQGMHGSFHEMAARKYFGDEAELVCCQTFEDVFDAVRAGVVDSAVVAIGNSRFGNIDKVYDQIINSHLMPMSQPYWIHGEVYVDVEQCLLGLPGTELGFIREVHSQAPALGQCAEFLSSMLPKATLIEQADTAGSAKLVAEWADKTKTAVASRSAAKLYGLEVLAAGIQDDSQNVTRFLVINTKPLDQVRDNQKTTLLLTTDHAPGALARALAVFSEQSISLAYIQSVPIPDKPFKYRFYIDIDPSPVTGGLDSALSGLVSHGYEVAVIGNYQPAALQAS